VIRPSHGGRCAGVGRPAWAAHGHAEPPRGWSGQSGGWPAVRAFLYISAALGICSAASRRRCVCPALPYPALLPSTPAVGRQPDSSPAQSPNIAHAHTPILADPDSSCQRTRFALRLLPSGHAPTARPVPAQVVAVRWATATTDKTRPSPRPSPPPSPPPPHGRHRRLRSTANAMLRRSQHSASPSAAQPTALPRTCSSFAVPFVCSVLCASVMCRCPTAAARINALCTMSWQPCARPR
jgi:hypothetical protein